MGHHQTVATRSLSSLLSLLLVAVSLLLMLATQPVQGSPIVNGHLGPWEGPLRHSAGLLRDPMPWEDGYFDPSYHTWPKNRQQQLGDKQSLKLTSDETVIGQAGKMTTKSS